MEGKLICVSSVPNVHSQVRLSHAWQPSLAKYSVFNRARRRVLQPLCFRKIHSHSLHRQSSSSMILALMKPVPNFQDTKSSKQQRREESGDSILKNVCEGWQKGALNAAIVLMAASSAFAFQRKAFAAPSVATVSLKPKNQPQEANTAEALRSRAKKLLTLSSLKKEEASLIKVAQKLRDSCNVAERELQRTPEGDGNRGSRESELREAETRFKEVWSKLTRLEAEMLSLETEALRLGLEDMSATQPETTPLFTPLQSSREGDLKDAAIGRMEKELEYKGKRGWERHLLPVAVGSDESELPLCENAQASISGQITKEVQHSSKVQERLDNLVRDHFKNDGDEKLLYVKRSEEEVLEGLAPLEPKWLFGDKEVHVSGAVGFQMAHDWKQWREEAKEKLKRKLLDDIELGKKYVSEKQDHILLFRDRVLAKTWYNVNETRWEMDPTAAAYAISKQLVGKACIRHDWRAMFIVLKGDETEYFVDIEEYNAIFEQVGGFDGLYIKMVCVGVPITVEKRPISIRELGFVRGAMYVITMSTISLYEMGRGMASFYLIRVLLDKIVSTYEEIMFWVGFKAIEKYIPRDIRVMMGMAWPEAQDENFIKSGFLEWQAKVQIRVGAQLEDQNDELMDQGILPIRDVANEVFFLGIKLLIYGFPFVILFFYVVRALILQFNDVLRTGSFVLRHATERYRRCMDALEKYGKRIDTAKSFSRTPAQSLREAFDDMRRIRHPPVRLKDIAGIDAIKEEVDEIISFLRNPKSFQEIGARAPRGILITGVPGSGKRSLAFAIAAEAKVPVVFINYDVLIVGEYVGEAASAVRELFSYARQLAPVIIFMENFENIGRRGNQSGVGKQEEIINQFLVELDGFETKEGVVVLAITNNPEAIDEALRRPGRMDKTITLPLPNEKERERILRASAARTMHSHFIDVVDWHMVAKKTVGMLPGELKLVPEAIECAALSSKICDADELLSIYGWLATIGNTLPQWLKHSKLMKKFDESLLNHLGLHLTKEDIMAAVDSMEIASPPLELYNFPTPVWTKEAKLPHAAWAVGRGLIASLLPNFDVVDAIWLDKTSWESVAFTKIDKQTNAESEDSHIETRSHLEKELVLCFGSYVALRMLVPDESNNLATPQIEEAMKIATRMVLEYGWGPNDVPMVYFTPISPVTLAMGKEHEFELGSRIEKLFYAACDKATEMLHKNKQVLDALVAYLLENECMLNKDISRILEENGAQREPEPFMLFPYKGENITIGNSKTSNLQLV
eukprot:TRINITY_DN8198_c0_g1_i1.p1 TRINITY_DN8198_c0_g1~~TRINITY_DN8198_c0_g1_i1.p1  ORF type:complete len:1255 (+),score=269.09 TRINITY_DN8198_c0_g1_i1:201-3965(+)